jgi:hypothetical protein
MCGRIRGDASNAPPFALVDSSGRRIASRDRCSRRGRMVERLPGSRESRSRCGHASSSRDGEPRRQPSEGLPEWLGVRRLPGVVSRDQGAEDRLHRFTIGLGNSTRHGRSVLRRHRGQVVGRGRRISRFLGAASSARVRDRAGSMGWGVVGRGSRRRRWQRTPRVPAGFDDPLDP